MSHGPHSYVKLGKKGLQRECGGYVNGFVKPSGKTTKRRAARRVRDEDLDEIPNGNFYKKLWGYWEWC